MRTSLNTQARLERALRNHHTVQTVWETFRTFKWFTLTMVTLLPIYPSLSVLGQNLETDVGQYDNSSIITAYTGDTPVDTTSLSVSDNGLVQTSDDATVIASTVPTHTATQETPPSVPDTRVASLSYYTVKSGDSLSKISSQYDISIDTIRWANDMTESDSIKPGMNLRIPPVSGVVYTVGKDDTLSEIAMAYKVDVADIVRVNNLTSAEAIREGRDLIIPGAIKPVAQKAVAVVTSKKVAIAQSPAAVKPKVKKSTETDGIKDRYPIEYTGKSSGFAWGNCTWYVAMHKNVTWRGNANQWISHAKAAGVKTGSIPVPGAIIQLSGG